MNKALLEARRKFRGQTALVKGANFDNSPVPEGTYTFDISESKEQEKTRKGLAVPVHYMRVTIMDGDQRGKSMFPFAPSLDDIEGIIASARNVRAILGDVVPGSVHSSGGFQVDVGAFLEQFDELAAQCIGEAVEGTVQNQKARKDGSHLKNDGTPWQNVYINRGLGDDAAGARTQEPKTTRETHSASASLSFKGKKKAAKKKVAKKKVTKKKRR